MPQDQGRAGSGTVPRCSAACCGVLHAWRGRCAAERGARPSPMAETGSGVKRMKRWGVIGLSLLTFQAVGTPDAQGRQYDLKQQRVGDSQTVLRLINRATGKALWKKRVAGLDCLGWSSDHRALALSLCTNRKPPFRLLVWQEGKPVRQLDDSPVRSGGYIDGVIDFAWSPDDRRVLFRVYQSSGKIMNDGLLYCLDTKRWSLSSLPEGVTHMQWVGPRLVRYRVMKGWSHGNISGEKEDPRPRYWKVG